MALTWPNVSWCNVFKGNHRVCARNVHAHGLVIKNCECCEIVTFPVINFLCEERLLIGVPELVWPYHWLMGW